MIDRILDNKTELAIIIRRSFKKEGIEFFTPDSYSQQIGYMNHSKGYKIKPHIHKPVNRTVKHTKEVLFIKSGEVRVDFYDNNKNYLKSIILFQGDIILLVSGGHGFEMLKKSEIIEVKQGPYAGENDKLRFESIDSGEVLLV